MTRPWEDERVKTGLQRQKALRARRLGIGAKSIGWKVGFGAPTALELLGIDGPLIGFLTDQTVVDSGASIGTAEYQRGVVEFEVAVYLGHDLASGSSDDEARAAIAAVGSAIEIADVDLPVGPDHVEEILAGDIFHSGLVLGQPDPGRAGLDISGLVARVLVDGGEVAVTADLEAITGAYPSIVRTVADTLAANGLALKAGDVIITGSVVPPIDASSGRQFTFALDPFSPISILMD